MSKSNEANSGTQRGLIRLILFGILFLLVVALIYDYRVARPGVNQAYDKITEQSTLVNMSSTKKFTNKDVQELLGKQPSETFEDPNGDFVEVYSWRSGLPFRTHDLFAVYKKNGDDWLFHRHQKFGHESSTDVSKYDGNEPLVIELEGVSPSDPQAVAAPGEGSGEQRPDAQSRPEPEADSGSSEPQADSGSSEPQADSGSSEPQADSGSSEPQADSGSSEPETDSDEEPEVEDPQS